MNKSNHSDHHAGSNPASEQKRRKKRFILLVAVPSIVLLLTAVVYLKGGRYVETDNAYIKAQMVPVSAEISGMVKEVLVKDNQPVAAGDLLFRLDPTPSQLEVDRAEARLAQVKTDLAVLKADYREKQAEIALAKTKNNFAMREQARQADLLASKYISTASFDATKQNAEVASQQVTALQEALKRITEALGGSLDTPVEQHPSYLAAKADLAQAKLDLSRVEIRASLPGTVSKPPKPGQYIASGNMAMALVVNGSLWIEANFVETDLTYVRPGQPVTIHVDTYPDTTWVGSVESLSPATNAEFSVIPAQNASGNWVKISQRVPVRININLLPGMPELRAGLSSVVEIDTNHHRRLLGLSF